MDNKVMERDVRLVLSPSQAASDSEIRSALGIGKSEKYCILRKSIDARRVPVKIDLLCRVNPQTELYKETVFRDVSGSGTQVVIVGSGPAGLFAALTLLEAGIRPVIVERGKDVHRRKADIALISTKGVVNPQSNYSFGEGGAGTFSDGKLFTRSKKRGENSKILNLFVQFGADSSILFESHPHIGTEVLPSIVENMRRCIVSHGGEFHQETCMKSLDIRSGTVKGCVCTAPDGEKFFEGPVILAPGNAARDVFTMLEKCGVCLEAKSLAVGVRMEHPQELIDRIQYHSMKRPDFLPPAEYSFTRQAGGRGVYSFCMCPGGFVVPAATEANQVVVNGMSPSKRSSKWANSGIVVQIDCNEISGTSPLRIMEFQRELEEKAFLFAGRSQKAPAQRLTCFLNGKTGGTLPLSSYTPGLTSSDLDGLLPSFVSQSLKAFFRQINPRLITDEACLIGVETRTSSPVRIVRDENTLQSVGLKGLYPCGEGAGYAGGIVSSAVDGMNCAMQLVRLLNPDFRDKNLL